MYKKSSDTRPKRRLSKRTYRWVPKPKYKTQNKVAYLAPSYSVVGTWNQNQVGTPPNCPQPTVWSRTGSANLTAVAAYGANYPDWRKRILRGQSATTLLTGTRYQFGRYNGVGSYTYKTKASYCNSGSFTGSATTCSGVTRMGGLGVYASDSPDPVALNHANSQLLKKYLAATENWRGGNFFAEFGETVEMLLHPLRSVYRRSWTFVGRLQKLKKVYQRDPLSYSKAIADLWLAYGFGVKPLLDDVNDFADTVTRYQSGYVADTLKIHARGKNSAIEYFATETGFFGSFLPVGLWQSDVTIKSDKHVIYDGAIRSAPTFGGRTLDQFGMGVFDIVPAVWEAIPFSFLVDYFLNVQEVLDSMRYWSAELCWLQRTVRNSATLNISPPRQQAVTMSSWSTTCSDAGFYGLLTRVKRESITSLPYPGFQLKFPAFSSLKWLNVAALARQFVKTKPVTPFLGGTF